MSLEATVLAIVLAGSMGVFVLLPLLGGEQVPPARQAIRGATPRQRHALETLEAEKYRILRAIRDLDFDYDMDKLTDDAYATQRVYLIRLALAIFKRIDALEAEIASQQARVEEAIAALRAARR
ncbi:MAG: hypothetical protein Kow00106_09800 [Anaerolineae bacterium]